MKQRQLQSFVYKIQDGQGREVEGFELVARLITTYYQKLLGVQTISRESVDRSIIHDGTMLTLEQQLDLIATFSNRDIKDAIWPIPLLSLQGLMA